MKRIIIITIAILMVVAVWRYLQSKGAFSHQPPAASQANIQVQAIPQTTLDVSGSITALDFVVDDKESLHVVWRASQQGSDKFLYARGGEGGTTWTTPLAIATNSLGDNLVRILSGPDGLHIVFGKQLRHFVSKDRGQSWQELPRLIPDEESRADVFDAVFNENSLVTVYLHHPKPYEPESGAQKGDQRLYVVIWSPTGNVKPRFIAAFPRSLFDSPVPSLVSENQRLHLLLGLNTERPSGESGGSVVGKLFYLRSDNRGVAWLAPVEISRSTSRGVTSSSKSGIQSISGVELLTTPERLYAFYHDTLLVMTYTDDGLTWVPARAITSANQSTIGAAFQSTSVSATLLDGQGRLAWIDTRFRKTDRRWWNPLGGFPWSETPDWTNNDIFTLPLSEASPAMDGSKQNTKVGAPLRITEPLSYAQVVRVRASTTKLFAVWAGRHKVGRQLDTFGQKPEIFFAAIPLP